MVVMIKRALLVMAWLAWFPRFILMAVIPVQMGFFHDLTRIGRKGTTL